MKAKIFLKISLVSEKEREKLQKKLNKSCGRPEIQIEKQKSRSKLQANPKWKFNTTRWHIKDGFQ